MTQRHDDRGLPIVMVQSDITATTKSYRPLPVFGIHDLNRPSNFRVLCQYIHTLANDSDGLFRRLWIFFLKEAIYALNVCQCRR